MFLAVAIAALGIPHSLRGDDAPPTLPSPTPIKASVDLSEVLVDNFQGWGTSLCWWANVVGGYTNRETFAQLAFGTLGLNIVRYNIGGGENPGLSNTLQFRAQVPGYEPANGVWHWNADQNQRWMLRRAVALGANHVIAFANSPPWWMTVSGSVTGSVGGKSNNLQTACETNFAQYLALVVSNLMAVDGVTVEAVAPMNEPTANWWTYGHWQEGCHMDAAQQRRVVNDLASQLRALNLKTGIAASEDNDERDTVRSIDNYDASGKSNLTLIASHSYVANNPSGLKRLARQLHRPLWISEYGDRDASGMTMARRIHDDITQTGACAWTYWQVVDGLTGWALIRNVEEANGGAHYSFNEKFHVMWQFSHFIRPGCRIVSATDKNSLAAYDATHQSLILVAVNDDTNLLVLDYDLRGFASLGAQACCWRTSAAEQGVPLANISVANQHFVASLAPKSVTTYVISNALPNSLLMRSSN